MLKQQGDVNESWQRVATAIATCHEQLRATWAERLPLFATLHAADQWLLFNAAFLELLVLRVAWRCVRYSRLLLLTGYFLRRCKRPVLLVSLEDSRVWSRGPQRSKQRCSRTNAIGVYRLRDH